MEESCEIVYGCIAVSEGALTVGANGPMLLGYVPRAFSTPARGFFAVKSASCVPEAVF